MTKSVHTRFVRPTARRGRCLPVIGWYKLFEKSLAALSEDEQCSIHTPDVLWCAEVRGGRILGVYQGGC